MDRGISIAFKAQMITNGDEVIKKLTGKVAGKNIIVTCPKDDESKCLVSINGIINTTPMPLSEIGFYIKTKLDL